MLDIMEKKIPTKKTDLQSKFESYLKRKKGKLRQKRENLKSKSKKKRSQAWKQQMRDKIIKRAEHYFGIPYSRKYHGEDSEFYNYHLYLDCCGLVRKVFSDFEKELGFKIGPWNQAYQYDSLPGAIQLFA